MEATAESQESGPNKVQEPKDRRGLHNKGKVFGAAIESVKKAGGIVTESDVEAPVEEDGAPEMLVAMRFVAKNKASLDRTQLHKDCRSWKAKDIKGFMGERAKLELAHREVMRALAGKVAGAGEVEAADEGVGRCVEMIDGLLKGKGWES